MPFLFFPPNWLKSLCCRSPGCVPGLGYSGAALLAHGGLWGERHPWWHYCVRVLLRCEIPLCRCWRHGSALPEEKVGGCASALCSWKNPLLFSVHIWENLSIDLFSFRRDHFHNGPGEQWFSQRSVQIDACLMLIFFPALLTGRALAVDSLSLTKRPWFAAASARNFVRLSAAARDLCVTPPTRTVIQWKTRVSFFVCARNEVFWIFNYLQLISGGQGLGFWHRAPGFWVWLHARRHMHDLWPHRQKVEAYRVQNSFLSTSDV